MTVTVWHVIGGVLDRVGRPPPRDGLVYGQYEPEAAATPGTTGYTAGLSNAAVLTDYNASSVNSFTCTNGQTFLNKTVHGDIRPPSTHTANITFTNCRLRGGPHIPSTNDAVIKADNTRSGTGRVILTDCEIDPQTPALNRDGARGNRVEIHRSWIHDTIDGFSPYATPTQNSGNAYSYLYGSVVENLRYGMPDYDNGVSGAGEHTDGTHNDCVSFYGGKNITIKGNLLKGTSTDLAVGSPPTVGSNPTHPQLQASGYAYGACVLIANTVSNPLDSTVIFEENWLMGGISHLNVKPNMACVVRNNRHYRAVFVGSTSSGYWIRYDQRSGNGVVADSDTWVDGPYEGDVLIEPRTLGMHFNA